MIFMKRTPLRQSNRSIENAQEILPRQIICGALWPLSYARTHSRHTLLPQEEIVKSTQKLYTPANDGNQ